MVCSFYEDLLKKLIRDDWKNTRLIKFTSKTAGRLEEQVGLTSHNTADI
jgi:hypothetical protein